MLSIFLPHQIVPQSIYRLGITYMDIITSAKGKRWDSILEPVMPYGSLLRLTLQIRLELVRIEPDSHSFDAFSYIHNGILRNQFGTVNLQTWSDGEWTSFRQRFASTIERFWNHKLVLMPTQPWYAYSDPWSVNRIDPSRIGCSLSIQVVDTPAGNPVHFRFGCVKTSDSFRSYASPEWRSGMLSQVDLNQQPSWRSISFKDHFHMVRFQQITAVHEIGHVLMLNHPRGPGGEEWAYGTTYEEHSSIMGAGDVVSATMARPWQQTLDKHLVRQTNADRKLQFSGVLDSNVLDHSWASVNLLAFSKKTLAEMPESNPGHNGLPSIETSTPKGPAGVDWKHLPFTQH
ncbi:hypothetical protein [Spirosoma flavum]|uniref:Peptidase metallopeptidase domain-containing protein n=1 Tax=Spirosoma flavum TaxID=2048557 RepID=A0ABW6ARD4_9BACT